MALPQERIRETQAPTADPTREYVVGEGLWSGRIGSVLSRFLDDAEMVVGLNVYERMSRDPVVAKDILYQKTSVTADGMQLIPSVSKKDARFELAQEIRDFCQRNVDNLHRPVMEIIKEQMDALKRAHTVAEKTYNEPKATGPDAYKLTLKSIKVKPRNTTAFVVDEFRNVLGLTAWTYGKVGLVDGAKLNGQKIIPREKFVVLTFETEDEDPRGLNPLRYGVNFWQAKCLVPGLQLKWLDKSGVPSTVGMTPPNADDEVETDAQGNPIAGGQTRSAQEVMADRLAQLESASAAAFPYGSEVKILQVAGDGSQFTRCYEDFDRQIDYALLLQSGGTKDSKYGNKSAKQILKDIVDVLIWSRKTCIAETWRREVFRELVEINYGEENADLTPLVMLGDPEGKDWASTAEALARLAANLTDSQWDFLCNQIGIPSPLQEELRPTRVKQSGSPVPTDTGDEGDDNEAL